MTPRSPDRRLRWRRRLLRAGVVPLVIALLLAVKVGVMLGADRSARASYDTGDPHAADSGFGLNVHLNLVETWVAPFGRGTSLYRLGDLTGSVRWLTEALETVPAEHECRVRINLALAHEALGDEVARDGLEGSAEQWRRGSAVVEDGGCLEDERADEQADRQADRQADDARAVAARLRGKVERAEAREQEADVRADELDRRNDLGERIRRTQEERREEEDRRDREPEPETPPTYQW